jgi:hypothetical protein
MPEDTTLSPFVLGRHRPVCAGVSTSEHLLGVNSVLALETPLLDPGDTRRAIKTVRGPFSTCRLTAPIESRVMVEVSNASCSTRPLAAEATRQVRTVAPKSGVCRRQDRSASALRRRLDGCW